MGTRLEGRVAVVTGASSGIGEATALALAAEGARVALLARRLDRLQGIAERITEAGGQAMQMVVDVANEGQIRAAIQSAHATLGNRLDILVNNAGIGLVGPIDGANTEDWRRMIDLNLMALMYATHATLPLMKAQGYGHVVNISSTAGRIAAAGGAVYCASKFAIGAFSEFCDKKCDRTKFASR